MQKKKSTFAKVTLQQIGALKNLDPEILEHPKPEPVAVQWLCIELCMKDPYYMFNHEPRRVPTLIATLEYASRVVFHSYRLICRRRAIVKRAVNIVLPLLLRFAGINVRS